MKLRNLISGITVLRNRRDALEASANELFEAVASGMVRIAVHQRFALKEAAEAHKVLEARATSGPTILTI
jgi:NADPH2:quinone reductase